MKNLFNGIAVIGIVILAFLPAACVSIPSTSGTTSAITASTRVRIMRDANFGEQLDIPLKDFRPVGLVFTEVQYQITQNNGINGKIFTFHELLKEAQKLNADSIINVVIDKRLEILTENRNALQETWYGSALAIKYTNIIDPEKVKLNKTYSIRSTNNAASSTAIGNVRISNDGIFAEHILIPAKDFEAAGLVFTEAKYEINTNRSTINGDIFTYHSLLKEAAKLNAHALINITIDRKIDDVTWSDGNAFRNETWFASALAIRYTSTLENDASLANDLSPRTRSNTARTNTVTNDGISIISEISKNEPRIPKVPRATDPAATRLNTIGVSVGSAFATPAFIGTLHGTFSPARHLFMELGMDFGLGYTGEDYEFDGYHSFYPFANIGFFAPFKNKGGWLIGAGYGFMASRYTLHDHTETFTTGALNLTTGFNIFNMITIAYTLRTDFDGASNKVSAGYVYRFN